MMNPHTTSTMPELRDEKTAHEMKLSELSEAAKKKKIITFKQYNASASPSRASPDVQKKYVVIKHLFVF